MGCKTKITNKKEKQIKSKLRCRQQNHGYQKGKGQERMKKVNYVKYVHGDERDTDVV